VISQDEICQISACDPSRSQHLGKPLQNQRENIALSMDNWTRMFLFGFLVASPPRRPAAVR
jgi:hypothetical protein